MNKYLILSNDRVDTMVDSIEEAREAIEELFEDRGNYYPRGIYKLIETHEVKRDIVVTPEPEDSLIIEEDEEEAITLLELVNKDMPKVTAAGHGCPWCASKFQKAFESQGYKFPGDKALRECPKFTCKECWNRPAERLIPTDGE